MLFAPAPAPGLVWAGPWLKGRADAPAGLLQRQPHTVWSSCDGSLVVSRGAWQRGTAAGWFATVWRRELDGRYKWVLTHSAPAATPLAVPEMLSAGVADCPERARRAGPLPRGKAKSVKFKDLPPLDPARRNGASADGSLRWEAIARADGSHRLTVIWKKDGAEVPLPAN